MDTIKNNHNVRIVKQAIDAISRSQIDELLSLFSDDMNFEMSGHTPFSRKASGKEEFLALFGEVMIQLQTGIPLSLKNLIPAGNWVICETQGHAFMSNGAPYENHYCMLWKLKDGKIIYLKEYNDTQLIMEKFNFKEIVTT